MAEERMYLGEVPKSVYDKELSAYLERRQNSDAKRVSAQFEYNGKKYTFQKAGAGGRYQLKHSGERVKKEAKRRIAEGKQTIQLSSVEQMMVDNVYEEASKRNLAVDHVYPVAKGGPTNAPWNLKLMQPEINSAKGAKVGGNWQYEPLMQQIDQLRQFVENISKPKTKRYGSGSPMGIQTIGGPTMDSMPPSQEGYGPGGIIRTIPTAHERL